MSKPAVALVALLVIVPLSAQQSTPAAPNASGRRVAITIDDGPVVNETTDLANFQRISAGLIGAFQTERVPVTIFINEVQLNVPGQRDSRAAVLEQWLDAGFELGNHGYSHVSASNAPLQEFTDDVVKGEVITRAILERRGRQLEWFRYPYLHSGATPDAHQAVMDFLASRGYRVAPVTVDYADYTFAGAYVRALRSGRADDADRINAAYLDQVHVGFEFAEKASIEVFGREVPQILLIHCNELNAVSLVESIARMRARGYAFISLSEAMADPVYARPDTFTGPGGSWLTRSASAAGKRIEAPRPRVPEWISTLAAGNPQP